MNNVYQNKMIHRKLVFGGLFFMKTHQIFPSIKQEIRPVLSYSIHFTTHLFSPKNPLLKNIITQDDTYFPKKILLVIDRAVAKHHPGLVASIRAYHKRHSKYISLAEKPIIITGGEQCKNNPRNVARIHKAVNRLNLCRHSYVIAIGGGALLDVVGYAAATAHRGVRLVRVPTTVLAQDDSGIGVKNAINAYGKKNFLGTFACPETVLIDFSFLRTLPDRDWRSGIAEAVKVALLKDPVFFKFIEKSASRLLARDMPLMQKVIRRAAELHAQYIATGGDPFETGSSRPLDFGHWSGHKLEQMSNFRLRHGEAVALGIALDTTYSYLTGFLKKSNWERILNVLRSLRLPLFVPELMSSQLLHGLQEFREHLGGRLTIMLLKNIGQGVEVHAMNEKKIIESVNLLKAYGKEN